ncbi:hypothetical protein E2320_005699, partial [Naja naja]
SQDTEVHQPASQGSRDAEQHGQRVLRGIHPGPVPRSPRAPALPRPPFLLPSQDTEVHQPASQGSRDAEQHGQRVLRGIHPGPVPRSPGAPALPRPPFLLP